MTVNCSRRGFLGSAFATATVGFGGCRSLGLFTGLRHDPALTAFLSDCHVCNWHGPDYQAKKFAEALARVLKCDPLPARLSAAAGRAHKGVFSPPPWQPEILARKIQYGRIYPEIGKGGLISHASFVFFGHRLCFGCGVCL